MGSICGSILEQYGCTRRRQACKETNKQTTWSAVGPEGQCDPSKQCVSCNLLRLRKSQVFHGILSANSISLTLRISSGLLGPRNIRRTSIPKLQMSHHGPSLLRRGMCAATTGGGHWICCGMRTYYLSHFNPTIMASSLLVHMGPTSGALFPGVPIILAISLGDFSTHTTSGWLARSWAPALSRCTAESKSASWTPHLPSTGHLHLMMSSHLQRWRMSTLLAAEWERKPVNSNFLMVHSTVYKRQIDMWKICLWKY